jgi:TRAP transporter 4TM/12TM fusion protein
VRLFVERGASVPINRLRSYVNLHNLTFVVSLIFFVWLVRYFYTGLGGPVELAVHLIPVALILQILFMYEQDYLYKWLPPKVNHAIVAIYIAIASYAYWYFVGEYERIAIYSQGTYTQHDFIVGLLVFLLVMELSRLAHPVLFWTNVVMVVYTLYGNVFPRSLDFFWHPGTTFERVVTSSTVELSTGIYGIYGQLALTLIAAFLLLAGVANGFNAQHAMINVVRLITRSRHLIPQTAVVGSSAIGMISGSGSANAAVVGTITIPLMIRYGVPPAFAAAVETSASMGGLIAPPMMGAAAFLMAEFLGVAYWDVVLRGFGFAFIYYVSIGVAVYLLSVRLLPRGAIEKPLVPLYEKVTTAIFFGSVAYLIALLGFVGKGELLAAVYAASGMFVVLAAVFLYFKYRRKDPFLAGETLLGSIRRAIETHAEMASYLTLLLATLGIMIGLFTVTGFINRMGAMLLEVGAWNIGAMIMMAWVFGWLLGTGLPPTATYIIGAVIIVPPMTQLGVNPWVAHFFVFFLSVWGELSPPTSLTAAVSARIANASFMRTMWEALKICLPLTLITFAIFTRSAMAIKPGWGQVGDVLLATVGTCGVAFAMFGRCIENWKGDVLARLVIALLACATLFHPNDTLVWGTGAVTLLAQIWGIRRHKLIASPKIAPEVRADAPARREDIADVVAQARRDIG